MAILRGPCGTSDLTFGPTHAADSLWSSMWMHSGEGASSPASLIILYLYIMNPVIHLEEQPVKNDAWCHRNSPPVPGTPRRPADRRSPGDAPTVEDQETYRSQRAGGSGDHCPNRYSVRRMALAMTHRSASRCVVARHRAGLLIASSRIVLSLLVVIPVVESLLPVIDALLKYEFFRF